MNTFLKNIFWAIGALLLIAVIFSFFVTADTSAKVFSMSDFATKINANEVTKIVVNGSDLTITLKDNTEVKATKEFESGLTETLKNYGVNPVALQKVALEIQEDSGSSFWLGVLVPSLLPIIVFVLF
jgi:ATP-dependent Zn protease